MLRRLFALSVLLLVALAPAAVAANVKIRVEGKTTTIFGPAQPTVTADNALQALDAASTAGEFYYGMTTSSFGDYVSQIGKYPASESTGWVFKVNGVSPPVGADKVELKDGDTVLWYWATFGPNGGPPTLNLARGAKAGCYRVTAQDDAGKPVSTDGVFLQVDSRVVQTKAGSACPGKHRGLVRAVKGGYVRSNSLP